MLGLRLDEPLPLAGLEARVDRGARSSGWRAARPRVARRAGGRGARADGARPLPRRRRHGRAARLSVPSAWPRAAAPPACRRTMRAEQLSDRQRGSSAASSRSTSRPASRSGRRRSSSERAWACRRRPCASELAELEPLGLLTHPHTSAGRVPTEHGYRFYADAARSTRLDAAPVRFALDLTAVAQRGRAGAPGDDGDAVAGHAAARARLCAAARGGHGPPRRGAAAAAARRDGRRDHVDRRRHEARLAFDAAGRPGARRLGAALPRTSRLAGLALGSRHAPPPARGPGSPSRERAFLDGCGRPSSTRSRTTGSGSSSAAPPGCSATRAATSSRLPRLLDVLERRAARARAPRRRPRSAPHRSSASAPSSTAAELRDVSSSAPPTGSRAARSAPSACSARCAWTTTRRSAPSAPRHSSSRGFVEDVYEDE